MKNNTLAVAEVFYSLQCEGRAIGTPAVFLRLTGCNLLCKSHNWVCDTIEVWKKGKRKEFKDVMPTYMIKRLKEGAHLVITGGEPLLQQIEICDYIRWMQMTAGFTPFIEIETNGTIIPSFDLISYVKWWNVSPKLENSGEPWQKRYNEPALRALDKCDSIFKFVVSNDVDFLEILDIYGFLDPKKFMLMPAGATRDELDRVRLKVVELAIKTGVRYSDRLHIVIWNQKTGV